MLKYVCFPAALALAAATVAQADNPNQTQRQLERQDQRQLNQGLRQDQRQQNQSQFQNSNANQQGVVVNDRNDRNDSQSQLQSHLANCLIAHNQEEIQLAQFAQQQSQNQKVKDLAQQMIQDHQQFNQKLQRFASSQPSARQQTQSQDQPLNQTAQNARTYDARDLNQDGVIDAREAANQQFQGQQNQIAQNTQQVQGQQFQNQNGRVEYRAAYGSAGNVDDQLLQIERDAVSKCQQMTRQELQKHQGADFDKAFVGMQIGAHIGLIAHLQAAEQAVSGDFQQVLKDGEQAAQQHKQHAEELKKELMKDHAK